MSRVNGVEKLSLSVEDKRGKEVAERYFVLEDGQTRTACPVSPSMFTLDERVIRQDCLGYLMGSISLGEIRKRQVQSQTQAVHQP